MSTFELRVLHSIQDGLQIYGDLVNLSGKHSYNYVPYTKSCGADARKRVPIQATNGKRGSSSEKSALEEGTCL